VPSYVIASALNGILAQRLVRGICQHCRKPSEPTESDIGRLGPLMNLATLQCFVGTGCVMCGGTGYKGRTAVFEILTFSPAIRELVSSNATEQQIRREALAEGMQTLFAATLNKVRAGKTTLSELFRVIEIDEVDTVRSEQCPSCGLATEPDYLACPACACRLAPACPACDRKVMEHWVACPYCCARLDRAGHHASKELAGPRAARVAQSPSPVLAAAQ
jgi:type IV pilus assembly protein PilB